MSDSSVSQEVVDMTEVEFNNRLTTDRKRVMNQKIAKIENKYQASKKDQT